MHLNSLFGHCGYFPFFSGLVLGAVGLLQQQVRVGSQGLRGLPGEVLLAVGSEKLGDVDQAIALHTGELTASEETETQLSAIKGPHIRIVFFRR